MVIVIFIIHFRLSELAQYFLTDLFAEIVAEKIKEGEKIDD